jgi:hypothetical protein
MSALAAYQIGYAESGPGRISAFEVFKFIEDMPAAFACADLVGLPVGGEHSRGDCGGGQACDLSCRSRGQRTIISE